MHRTPPKTFFNVQALRGIAACMVVLFHASEKWSIAATGRDSMAWSVGASGVDIFFVISGFVMATSSLSKGNGPQSAWEFFKRRLVRILPLYWIITTVLVIKIDLGLVRNTAWTGAVPLPFAFCSYLLIPYLHGGETSPILGQGWTLSYEMFFYLLFAAALAIRKSVPQFLTFVLCLLVLIGSFRTDDWPAITVLLRPMLLEFLAGLWLGVAALKGRFLGPRLSISLAASAVLTELFLHPTQPFVGRLEWGVCSILIFQAAVALEPVIGKRIPRWMLLVGDASYSIYLVHPMFLGYYTERLKAAHVLLAGRVRLQDDVITLVVCLGLSLLVGIVVYKAIELPLNHRLQRLMRLRAVQIESAS